jgi:hypothetical protein
VYSNELTGLRYYYAVVESFFALTTELLLKTGDFADFT